MAPPNKWKGYITNGLYFLEIEPSDESEQCYTNFVERWGAPDTETLLHVIQNAKGKDLLVAMRALRYANIPQTVPYLLPFLESSNLDERWTSAISLGELHIPQVYPLLKSMLTEGFLTPAWFNNSDFQLFDGKRLIIIHILGKINDPTVVPLFEDILQRMIQIEKSFFVTEKYIEGSNLDLWYFIQDAVVYTLGLYQAFDTIFKFPIPEQHRHHWMVLTAAGSIDITKTGASVIGALLEQPSSVKAVAHTIHEKYTIPLNEAHTYIKLYTGWYFDRIKEKNRPFEGSFFEVHEDVDWDAP